MGALRCFICVNSLCNLRNLGLPTGFQSDLVRNPQQTFYPPRFHSAGHRACSRSDFVPILAAQTLKMAVPAAQAGVK